MAVLTMVAVLVSVVLWHINRPSSENLAEAQGTITEVNYVRSGSVVNASEVSAKFDSSIGPQTLTFIELATDSAFVVGNKISISFPADSPNSAVPTYQIASSSQLNNGHLIFTILVGFVVTVTVVFARNESQSRAQTYLPPESATAN